MKALNIVDLHICRHAVCTKGFVGLVLHTVCRQLAPLMMNNVLTFIDIFCFHNL